MEVTMKVVSAEAVDSALIDERTTAVIPRLGEHIILLDIKWRVVDVEWRYPESGLPEVKVRVI